MNSIPWETIAASLREELANFGRLLGLFEEQQRHLFERNADAVLRVSHEIEQQAQTLGEARLRREDHVAALAAAHGMPRQSSLRSMLHLVEPAVRPLLEALINEVNLLLHRVRRVSRQNHSLLTAVVETNRQTLQLLRPGAFSPTYSASGHMAVHPAATPSLQGAG